jgi:hypothetical protein
MGVCLVYGTYVHFYYFLFPGLTGSIIPSTYVRYVCRSIFFNLFMEKTMMDGLFLFSLSFIVCICITFLFIIIISLHRIV